MMPDTGQDTRKGERMRMVVVKCDRCKSDMDPQGDIGKISWGFKRGIEGMLGENQLYGKFYCEHCMDLIMNYIQNPEMGKLVEKTESTKKPHKTAKISKELPKTAKRSGRPSSISKEKGEAIRELKERGYKIREIAEELEMTKVQVQNFLYRKR